MYNMINLLAIGLALSAFSISSSGEGPTQEMMQYSVSYGLDEKEAQAQLENLFSTNRHDQLAAIDYFEERKAYRVIAVAFPRLKKELKATALNALGKVPQKDVVVISVLVQELEDRNNILELPESGEALGGHEKMKERLVEIISRLSGVAKKDVDPQSQESVKKFISAVRAGQVVEPNKPGQEPPPTNSVPAQSK